MSRKAMLLLALLPTLACDGRGQNGVIPPDASVGEQVQQYDLSVLFVGLVAFADATHGGKEVVWALLPDANYIGAPQEFDLPPCIKTSDNDLAARFPPHYPALRFTGAQVDLDGQPVDVKRVFLIDEKDIRFTTGLDGPSTKHKDKLSTKEELHKVKGGNVQDYEKLDKVDAKFIKGDSDTAAKERYLGARVLIDFGSEMRANTLNCGSGTLSYGFRAPGATCVNPSVELAEDVVVTQKASQPVKISLLPGAEVLTVRPAVAGGKVTIEVLNVVQRSLIVPAPNPCIGMRHLEAYRWFYRLLTDAGPCEKHFFPCLATTSFGGDRCPLKGL